MIVRLGAKTGARHAGVAQRWRVTPNRLEWQASKQHSAMAQGFTLLELLVAIAVFALLSLGVYQVVDGVRRADDTSVQLTARMMSMQRAMQLLHNDFTQTVPRRQRSDALSRAPLLSAGEGLLQSQGDGWLLIRAGVANPQMQLPRGHLQRVGYRLQQGQLQRLSWPFADMPADSEPQIRTVLNEVDSLQLTFYHDGQWQRQWQNPDALPNAVRLRLTVRGWGELERVWLLPAAPLPQSDNREPDAGNHSGTDSGGNG